jgi:hypothetical protein
MGIVLAVLVLAALSGGFLMLMALPLVYIWLAIAIYKEPWKEGAPESVPESAEPEPEALPPPEPTVERPRVMAAGRRRPLP